MKKVLILLLSIFTLLAFISCGSKPEEEEAVPEAPVIEETEEIEQTEQAEEPEVADEPETDAESYEALLAKIADARQKAIDAGAESDAPDQLKQIDDYFESLKANENDLMNNSDDLLAKYELLANFLKAKSAKEEIDEMGFAGLDQRDYNSGCENLAKIEEAYADGYADSSLNQTAADAYADFNKVLTIGYKKLAKEAREAAYQAKKNADSVKAGVAQRERYNAAADEFKTGDSIYAMQNAKKAIEKYNNAEEAFTELFNEVSEKRAAAQAAIEAAKKAVAESESFALEADEEAPIAEGEEIEGIEDEDAVLLEEDEYEDPSDAEVEIAETSEVIELDEDEEAAIAEQAASPEDAESSEDADEEPVTDEE